MSSSPRIIAIVPCHNEEAAIAKVVTDLHETIPGIDVFVYDNCSTDRTAQAAAEAGAHVRYETEKGKGNVVRRAFADLDADIYLLIDGDDTYDVADAPAMIDTLLAGPFDHVLGVRRQVSETAYRSGHESGNKFFNTMVSFAFRREVTDMLSGYRVFSQRFVKSFPALSREFEIETELTIHAVNARVPQTEVEVGFVTAPRARRANCGPITTDSGSSASSPNCCSTSARSWSQAFFRSFLRPWGSSSACRSSRNTSKRAWCRGSLPRSWPPLCSSWPGFFC